MPKFVWRHHYNCHSYSTLAVSFYSFIFFFSVEECSNFLFFIVIDMNDNFTFTIACPCRPNNPASFLPISPEELTRLAHNMKKKPAPLSFCKKCNWLYWTLKKKVKQKNTSLVSGQLIVNKLFFSSKETVHLTLMRTTFLHVSVWLCWNHQCFHMNECCAHKIKSTHKMRSFTNVFLIYTRLFLVLNI